MSTRVKRGDRIRVTLERRIAGTPADTTVRWEKETLFGSVERAWRDLLLVQFEGARQDGSSAGCLMQIHPRAVIAVNGVKVDHDARSAYGRSKRDVNGGTG